MMRKEVKLGLAIGGVLLAVLVVYVLVVPGESGNQPGADLAGGGTPAITPSTPSEATPPTRAPAETIAQAPSDSAPGNQAPAATGTPTDPFSTQRGTSETTVAEATPSPAGGEVDWATLLQGGQVPPLMSQTPVATRSPSGAQAGLAETGTSNASSQAPSPVPSAPVPADSAYTAQPPAESLTAHQQQPTTQPISSATRTHVVQTGETLSAISIAAYGSAKYTRQIAAANPNINPDRIKPGQVIALPDASSFKTAPNNTNTNTASATPAALDATKEYRVQNGDSLYKISMKLYGKGDRTTKLYELNKQTIGEDPQRLKIGMVLKLPEAPTATVSR